MKSYIPTINISSLIKNNFNTKKANQTIKQIEKACINVGFFQITGHGINLKEIKNTCNVGNKFFNSSKINKQKLSPKKWNKKNKNLYRGYFPNDVNGKEGLDIGDLKVTKNYSFKIYKFISTLLVTHLFTYSIYAESRFYEKTLYVFNFVEIKSYFLIFS